MLIFPRWPAAALALLACAVPAAPGLAQTAPAPRLVVFEDFNRFT